MPKRNPKSLLLRYALPATVLVVISSLFIIQRDRPEFRHLQDLQPHKFITDNLRKWNGDDPPNLTNEPPESHPVDNLMAQGNQQFDQLRSHESMNVNQLAVYYRKRRGRHPPPAFNDWYEFAHKHERLVVEDFFDPIYEDLEPWWAIPPDQIRDLSLRWPNRIQIRNGYATLPEGVGGEKMNLWLAAIEQIEHLLPDVDIPFNDMGVPRVLAPWEEIDQYIQGVKERKETSLDAKLEDIVGEYEELDPNLGEVTANLTEVQHPFVTEPQTWEMVKKACPPWSAARSDTSPAELPEKPQFFQKWPEHSFFGYVTNFTTVQNICGRPGIRQLHGSYVSPLNISTTNKFIPVFSASKMSVNNDIRVPSPYWWSHNMKTDHFKWEEKEDKLTWRGLSSGGNATEQTWKFLHRHRFVAMLNGTQVYASIMGEPARKAKRDELPPIEEGDLPPTPEEDLPPTPEEEEPDHEDGEEEEEEASQYEEEEAAYNQRYGEQKNYAEEDEDLQGDQNNDDGENGKVQDENKEETQQQDSDAQNPDEHEGQQPPEGKEEGNDPPKDQENPEQPPQAGKKKKPKKRPPPPTTVRNFPRPNPWFYRIQAFRTAELLKKWINSATDVAFTSLDCTPPDVDEWPRSPDDPYAKMMRAVKEQEMKQKGLEYDTDDEDENYEEEISSNLKGKKDEIRKTSEDRNKTDDLDQLDEKKKKRQACAATGPFYSRKGKIPYTSQHQSKLVASLDSYTHDERFPALLHSTSLPIKSTLYQEWFSPRFVAWKHYVPLDPSYQDLYGILDYYLGYKGNGKREERMKKIAREGREWAERVLTRDDMLVYLHRLILEWSRLQNEQRERMGWVEDLRGLEADGVMQ